MRPTFQGICLLLSLVLCSCATVGSVAPLGTADHSLFLFIDGSIYECRPAGDGARALDAMGSDGGLRAVCTRTTVANR